MTSTIQPIRLGSSRVPLANRSKFLLFFVPATLFNIYLLRYSLIAREITMYANNLAITSTITYNGYLLTYQNFRTRARQTYKKFSKKG